MIKPRRGGPYPHLRLSFDTKVTQGLAVAELVYGRGMSYKQAAVQLGMSPTTSWRRCWFLMDWLLPEQHGVKASRLPPMRGTRACPRGRPYIPELDGPDGAISRQRKELQR
ncbi:hypothetical protein ABZ027_08365 [Streptomyces sp. NPDC006332]|uniref:hypothetical protein n=1 Tax=Streptomyces sp. NPDC006332 TaxID=3155456 RepID=UPI0033A33234